jgi:hypothetical protein
MSRIVYIRSGSERTEERIKSTEIYSRIECGDVPGEARRDHFMRTSPLRSAALRTVAFCVLAFAVLALVILSRDDRPLSDFDGSFYITIAYDLDRYGLFSNGIFSDVEDNVVERPKPGMFFGPVFPSMVYAAMKLDSRFAEAVRCSVEAERGHRDEAACEPYTRPIRLINALLLAIGATAVASAARLVFPQQRGIFLLTGLLVLAPLWFEAWILRLVMTESTLFGLYSLLSWAVVLAWKSTRPAIFAASGLLLGVLCLTKPSFLALFPLIAALTFFCGHRIAKLPLRRTMTQLVAFTLALGCVLGAWAARNAISVGKFALTEEYGSAAVIERFAYDDMTAREFFQAFPYCVPGPGDLLFDQDDGTDSMHRFVYHTPGSFFHMGRDRRNTLTEENGRLDPLIRGVALEELRTKGWRYVLVNIPLVWCGMWPGWIVSLPLLPLFVFACVRAVRRREPMFLLYSAPALLMLGLHAAVGNHTTRYNLILIGPYAVAAAWLMWTAWRDARWRSRSPEPAP